MTHQPRDRAPRGRRALLAIATLALALIARPMPAMAQDLACQGHDTFAAELIERAQQRVAQTSANNDVALQNITTTGDLGLSTTGPARFIVIRVSFPAAEDGSEPAMAIPASQTNEDLAALFNGTEDDAPAYPHESLNAYYERASYGKFDPQAAVVVGYTAQHNRSYYEGNVNALFYEALAGVDGQVDFSTCDANNDGKIDGIYLQYAGPTGEWGSTWWPAMRTLSDDAQTFDGKLARGAVLIKSDAETNDEFNATLIHETGHVLGLPDLYHYTDSALGLRTFDLMQNNTGDTDAFLKWMLDWIDAEKITYVHVSERGVDVRRGLGAIEHHDGSVEEALAAYSEDGDATATGGFIAVSSDATILDGNLLCNFYLLQYAHRAGNDTVSTWQEDLGHGFRIYRVQGSCTDDGGFARSNNMGAAHEQLIEALLPSDDGTTEWELGNLWHAGMSVTPATAPSTNYGESEINGYSGIALEVLEDGDNAGQVRISWSGRPSREPLALTCETVTPSSNSEAYVLSLSREASTNWWLSNPCRATLVVDGAEHEASWNLDETTRRLTLYTQLAADEVKPGAKLQVRFPAGSFVLAYNEQRVPTEVSDEIVVDLPVSDVATIEGSGLYPSATASVEGSRLVSEIFEVGGTNYFFTYTYSYETLKDELALYRLATDGKSCERVDVAGATNLLDCGATSIAVQPIDDGQVFVRLLHSDSDPEIPQYASDVILDISAAQVLATREESAEECAGTSELFPVAGGAAHARRLEDCSWELWAYRLSGTELVATRSVWEGDTATYVERIIDAGEGYVATLRPDNGNAGVVRLFKAEGIADATSFEAEPLSQLEVPSNFHLGGVRVAGNRVYVLALNNLGSGTTDHFANELLVYDLAGSLIKRAEVERLPVNFSLNASLRVGSDGSVALCATRPETSERIGASLLNVLLNASLEQAGEFTSYSGQGVGTWVQGRWLALDWELLGDEVPEQLHVHWTLTAKVGPAEPVEPVTPVGPTTPGGTGEPSADGTGAEPNAPASAPDVDKSEALPSTGDVGCNAIAFLAMTALVSLLGGLLLTRRRNRI